MKKEPLKPLLLPETAEIALTEIKRFLEPRLMEQFQLRRVSAPLFLPVGSPCLRADAPGIRVMLPGACMEVELVRDLDLWLRKQLSNFDIAPGFGVYTIMNAIRSEVPFSRTHSPQLATWAWQRVATTPAARSEIDRACRELYSLLVATEHMVLDTFPHLKPTLAQTFETIEQAALEQSKEDYSFERRLYELLHPAPDSKSNRKSVLVVGGEPGERTARLWCWNQLLGQPLLLAEISEYPSDVLADASIGGNIYRDALALQILHLDRLLSRF